MLLRRAQFGQYDKRKYFGRRKATVVLRKVAEGLRFTCGQYASFTFFAVSLRFTAFRRFRRILAEKLNIREHARNVRKVTETRGSSGSIFAVSCGSLRLNRISVKGVLPFQFEGAATSLGGGVAPKPKPSYVPAPHSCSVCVATVGSPRA